MRIPIRRSPFSACLAAALLLVACSPHDATPRITQVAARVNGGEITVHQINFLLESELPTAALPLEQRKAALAQLIDQEVLVQAARAQKLDRSPNVLAAMEAARRTALAAAYLRQVTANLPEPGADAVHTYYLSRPALFAQRRVYSLRELRIDIEDGNAPALEGRLRAAWDRGHDWDRLAALVRAEGLHASSGTREVPAEQLPLDQVDEYQRAGAGSLHLHRPAEAGGDLLVVTLVTRAVADPMDEARARPLIEAYLRSTARDKAAQAEIARLKAAANIELVGDYASGDGAAGGR